MCQKYQLTIATITIYDVVPGIFTICPEKKSVSLKFLKHPQIYNLSKISIDNSYDYDLFVYDVVFIRSVLKNIFIFKI